MAIHIETFRETGAIMLLQITYDNYKKWTGGVEPFYYYKPTVVHESSYKYYESVKSPSLMFLLKKCYITFTHTLSLSFKSPLLTYLVILYEHRFIVIIEKSALYLINMASLSKPFRCFTLISHTYIP